MSPEAQLGATLERALDDLPSLPATTYLLEGRRVRRRRRVVTTLVVAPVLALGAGLGLDLLASGGAETAPSGTELATEAPAVDPADLGPDPDYVAPEPNNPVEAVDGLDGVDWFTTPDVPEWAQEYGNHGPVALAPDGRLWVAPEATVRRTVVDPYAAGERGVTASYAVEAEYPGAPAEMADDVVWVILSTDGTGPGVGFMDEPGRWTDDFELWVDDATATLQGRPSFAERLVRFAGDGSSALVPGAAGVEIVQQQPDPELGPDAVASTRSAVAEVRWGGETWYVLAVDPRGSAAWYEPHEGSSQPDLAAFLDSVRGGA